MPSLDIARIVHHDGLDAYRRELKASTAYRLGLLGVQPDDADLVLAEFDLEWTRNLEEHDQQVIHTYVENIPTESER